MTMHYERKDHCAAIILDQNWWLLVDGFSEEKLKIYEDAHKCQKDIFRKVDDYWGTYYAIVHTNDFDDDEHSDY